MLIAPPYCGVPRLFHQFPVVVVSVVVGERVVVGVEVVVDVVVVFVVDVVVDVGMEVVDVVVDLAQDAKTSDVTMIQISIIQTNPLFI